MSLKSRIDTYIDSSDPKLLGRLPIIICINGRSFSKTTSLLEKPFCSKLSECFLSTMLKLCYDVEGAIFGYQHNDEICLLLRNNQHHETTPWFDNKLQKICSVSSSIASVHFNNCANTIDLDLLGDPIFTSQVFVVPDLTEATNTMIYKQQHNAYASVNLACFYELIKKYDKDTIKKMINGMNLDDRIELLNQECGIDFNDYPAVLRRGSACYKAPKITTDGVRNKWIINNNLPIFAKDQNFLNQIFRNGTDIVRTETVNGLLQNNLP